MPGRNASNGCKRNCVRFHVKIGAQVRNGGLGLRIFFLFREVFPDAVLCVIYSDFTFWISEAELVLGLRTTNTGTFSFPFRRLCSSSLILVAFKNAVESFEKTGQVYAGRCGKRSNGASWVWYHWNHLLSSSGRIPSVRLFVLKRTLHGSLESGTVCEENRT